MSDQSPGSQLYCGAHGFTRCTVCRRQAAGGLPTSRLNARANAAELCSPALVFGAPEMQKPWQCCNQWIEG